MTLAAGVAWETLTHAYGSAADVPLLLEMLDRDDEASRTAALGELWGNVFHQGTRYEASRHVVAPLIEITQRPGPRRAEIVSLITHLAVGYPEGWISDGFDPDVVRAANGPAGDDEGRVYAIGAYDAVCARSGALVSLLDDPEQDVQVEAAHALAFLPDVAASTIPRLITCTEPSRPAPLVAGAALALSLLHQAAPFDLAPLVERLSTEREWVVRFAAAGLDAAPGIIDPPSARSHATLVEAMTHDQAGTERQPWNDGDLPGFAAVILGRRYLDDHTLELICDALVTAPPQRRTTVVGVALHQLFPAGSPDVPESARDLDTRQHTLVRALTNASLWRVGSAVLGNFGLLVVGYGLPGDAQSMSRWLHGSDLNSCLPVGLRKRP